MHNYPPGVTGNEPTIAGDPRDSDYEKWLGEVQEIVEEEYDVVDITEYEHVWNYWEEFINGVSARHMAETIIDGVKII